MRTDLVVVALAVGLGTWLFRFLPTRLRSVSSAPNARLARAMESIGPAAITTLFVASALPGLTAGAYDRLTALVVGCAATMLAFLVKRNVVLATLAGAAAYGAAVALLGS